MRWKVSLWLALAMIAVGWTGLAVTVGWFFGGMARLGEEVTDAPE